MQEKKNNGTLKVYKSQAQFVQFGFHKLLLHILELLIKWGYFDQELSPKLMLAKRNIYFLRKTFHPFMHERKEGYIQSLQLTSAGL